MFQKALSGLWATCVVALLQSTAAFAATDVVLYATDATNLHGNWALVSDSTAAGGQMLASTDLRSSWLNAPAAAPADYFEATFTADANTPYHLWMRLRAQKNSKNNDSAWVQFSDALDGSGA